MAILESGKKKRKQAIQIALNELGFKTHLAPGKVHTISASQIRKAIGPVVMEIMQKNLGLLEDDCDNSAHIAHAPTITYGEAKRLIALLALADARIDAGKK